MRRSKMAAVKELVFEAMELAAACESGYENRYKAIINWTAFCNTKVDQYGTGFMVFLSDIYDSIADRSGDYWELYQESN